MPGSKMVSTPKPLKPGSKKLWLYSGGISPLNPRGVWFGGIDNMLADCLFNPVQLNPRISESYRGSN